MNTIVKYKFLKSFIMEKVVQEDKRTHESQNVGLPEF